MIDLKQFTINRTSETNDRGQFEIGPLPQGYGHTLGNILRRVLLTSIPGTAITAVKVNGVLHEYSTVDGVSDDVLALLLSVKNIVLVSKTHDTVVLKLKAKGSKDGVVEVKAGDIEKNSDVEIINPDYVITKLTGPDATLELELVVNRGVGYHLPDGEVRKEIGMLPLDANFSPVLNVSYEVVQTRVGQETELDQLNLNIVTNGAVTPIEALHVASDILNEMTSHLVEAASALLKGNEVSLVVGKASTNKQDKEKNSTPLKVTDLDLSTRLVNALVRSGFDDLRKLEGMTEEEVANIRGMGEKSFRELIEVLKKHNINLI
ncbi:MAG: DNA-directed RNA polymerase subunit alpha [Candidatus Dojkabacteria bacterium]|nr:MAG: DNA-directed RNA polymerase subunit alpha [Candidatus Dojkabacteria bacterium]